MGAQLQPTEAVTGTARLSFCHLFEMWGDEKSSGPKYSVTLLIPKNDAHGLQRMFAAYDEAVKEGMKQDGKWGGKKPAGVDLRVYNGMGESATPIYDGDATRPSGESFGEEARGHYVLTASDKSKRPDLVDATNQPIVSAFDVSGRPTIYSGCYGRAYIAFFPYNHNGKKGIGCALRAVQKIADGEPLSAQRLSPDDAFSAPAASYAAPAAYAAPTAPQYGAAMPATPTAGYPGAYAPQQPSYGAPSPQAAYGAAYAAPQAAYGAGGYAAPQAPAPGPGFQQLPDGRWVNPITGEIR